MKKGIGLREATDNLLKEVNTPIGKMILYGINLIHNETAIGLIFYNDKKQLMFFSVDCSLIEDVSKTGIELIADERKNQIEKHGRTVERDVRENPSGELALGAINLIHKNCYWSDFPGSWNRQTCEHMANKPYKERLVIAGALISAEIDRLQNS
jgi:hypothetical protein